MTDPLPFYERFTAAARKIMLVANREADQHGHDYVGNLHILFAAIETAPEVLTSASVNIEHLRDATGERLRRTPTAGAKTTIMNALAESQSRGDDVVDVRHSSGF